MENIIDKYKLAIIHGKMDEKRNINVGDLECVGDDLNDLHSNCLIQYAKDNHSDISIFQQLNNRHRPEVIGFLYLHYFNDIIFFNTTKNVERHGYIGFFLLPDNITKEQKKTLYEFASIIEKYSVFISHSLKLEDGILTGDEMYSFDNETPSQLLDKYFNNKSRGSRC